MTRPPSSTTPTDAQLTDPGGRDVLIHGATVLSVDPAVGNLDRGDVLLRDDGIVAVGPDLSDQARPGALAVDATGTTAIPGLVDAHVHAWESLLRGIAPVVDFEGYLGVTAFGYGPRYRPDDVRTATLVTGLTALDGGVTTLIDNAHNALTPDHARAGIEGLVASGVRGVHAVGAPFGSGSDGIPELAATLRDELAGPRLSVRVFEVNPSVQMWRAAQEHGLWISTELGTHTPDLEKIFDELGREGLLTTEHAFNHCYDLPPRLWSMIRDSGAAVNMTARSDAAFGLGSAVSPVGTAIAYGVPIGISNDNEVSYRLDMFAEMAALQLRHRGEVFRRRASGDKEATDDLTPARLLESATLGGAANAGLTETVGSLTPGKQADLVLLRTDADLAPALDPVAAVTAFAHPGLVDTVFVGGRLRKRGGRLLGDLDGVRRVVADSRTHLGIPTP